MKPKCLVEGGEIILQQGDGFVRLHDRLGLLDCVAEHELGHACVRTTSSLAGLGQVSGLAADWQIRPR